MKRVPPADEFDNPEHIRTLVAQIAQSSSESAEKLVILLRLVANPERSQIANGIALSDAVSYAFMYTCEFDRALEAFVHQPLRAVA